ncbi:MAG: BspA family leucine-rich repeat surface protein, partial [Saprospirales bacterium]
MFSAKLFEFRLFIIKVFVIAFLILIQISVYSQRPFITTWNTENSGVTDSNEILIPGSGSSYLIEWEEIDNPVNSGSLIGSQNQLVSFPGPGIYRVSISGDFQSIQFNNEGDRLKLLSIEQWGDIKWTTMESAFMGCNNMELNATDTPDLSRVESMSKTFFLCFNFNSYINHWDVSNVTNMDSLFALSIFNQPLSDWDVSKVTTMSGMFSYSLFNQDLNNWDVSNVTNMSWMFSGATDFNGDISNWDVSNVTNMSWMFSSATDFNGDISNWDVSNVTDMSFMFNFARNFNVDIDFWDVSSVTNMSAMFWHVSAFNQPLNNWYVSNVKDMSGMFNGASSFNQPLDNWDVSGVTNMGGMFLQARTFNQPLNIWDVSSVTDMGLMFQGAISFNQPLDNWDVSKVKSMGRMFKDATSFNQPLNSWDVSGVEIVPNVTLPAMYEMFAGATSFNQPLDNWDVYGATDMRRMFYGATSFDQNLGKWEFNEESRLNEMFDRSGMGCENYDLTLMGWADNPNTPDNRTLGAIGLHYWLAADARAILTNEKGWNISGDAFADCDYKDCDLPPTTINILGQYPSCPGEEIRLRAEGDGEEYFWFKDGQPIVGQNERTLVVIEAGLYSVIYTDDQNCESEESDALEIIFLDPSDPPILLNVGDAVLRSTRPNCRGFAFWEAEILTCGDINEIEKRSHWRLDLFNTGQFDILSTQPRPDGSARNNLRIEEELPLGIHRLVWEIRDEHGNLLIEEQFITLVDMNPPNPVCMHGISTNLSSNTGAVTIPARVFDVGSWDDCTDKEDLIFTFSSDLSHTHHTWTCDDLDGEQEITFTVEIWVTNQYGH